MRVPPARPPRPRVTLGVRPRGAGAVHGGFWGTAGGGVGSRRLTRRGAEKSLGGVAAEAASSGVSSADEGGCDSGRQAPQGWLGPGP